LSNADSVLKEIERMTERKFLPIIGPRRGRVLVDVILEIKPKRVLEVGTLVGYSAILMGKELGRDAHLTTIEIHEKVAEIARENIRKAEIPPTVEVIVGGASKVLPRLTGRFDMVFIDADKTAYLEYLRLVEDRLRKGSVVVADNVGASDDQMKDYLDYVRSSGKYSSRYIAVEEDGVEVSVRL
jgi:predicted O-methyltransferase YrrM